MIECRTVLNNAHSTNYTNQIIYTINHLHPRVFLDHSDLEYTRCMASIRQWLHSSTSSGKQLAITVNSTLNEATLLYYK